MAVASAEISERAVILGVAGGLAAGLIFLVVVELIAAMLTERKRGRSIPQLGVPLERVPLVGSWLRRARHAHPPAETGRSQEIMSHASQSPHDCSVCRAATSAPIGDCCLGTALRPFSCCSARRSTRLLLREVGERVAGESVGADCRVNCAPAAALELGARGDELLPGSIPGAAVHQCHRTGAAQWQLQADGSCRAAEAGPGSCARESRRDPVGVSAASAGRRGGRWRHPGRSVGGTRAAGDRRGARPLGAGGVSRSAHSSRASRAGRWARCTTGRIATSTWRRRPSGRWHQAWTRWPRR